MDNIKPKYTPAQLHAVYHKLMNDFPTFSKYCLVIRDKSGKEIPFTLNKAQKYLHAKLEEQKARTGKVRALVLKGRQQGCSTYTAGRFFHQAVTIKGQAVYILSHEGSTTTKLFGIAKNYYEHMPSFLKPKVVEDNAKSFKFENTSSYTVGTAGNKNTGRGGTVQLFHGCVHEDSLIVLADGSTKTMRDIEEGDLVITSSGEVAPVTLKTNTGVKQTYEIKTWLTNESIKVSKDHKILTQRGWVKTEDISKDDYIRLPEFTLNNSRKFYDFTLKNLPKKQNQGTKHREYARVPLDYNFGYLLGYYLAEGHLKKQSKEPRRLCQVQFACHENENFFENIRPLVEKFSISIKEEVTPGTHRKRITCYGTFLAEMINSICGRVEDKRIPSWFFNTNKEFLTGVLRGYLDGDGSKTDDTRTRATCIRERIIRQMKRIALALKLGVPGLSYHSNRRRYDKDNAPAFVMSLNGFSNRRFKGEYIPFEHFEKNCKYKRIDGKWYVKIKSIIPADVATTYDIEVGHSDHDFDTPIGIVSNSEVAFYENTDELQTGVMQSIADIEGTEIILESTANGLGNYFHNACMSALRNEGEFILVFIPWFWQEEYSTPAPSDFQLTEEEIKLKETYGLTDNQLCWRRLKILSFGQGGEWKFKQEYPCSVHEAFVSSGESMIPAEKIYSARKRENADDLEQPMILGIDPARRHDRFVIVPRRGRKMYRPIIVNPKEYGDIKTDEAARFILDAVEEYSPEKCFIDVTKDWGVYDYLVNAGFGRLFTPVVFSEGALRKELYLNKRVEMLMEVRDWFDAFEVDIPDDDAVHSDIAAVTIPRQTAGGRWMIESKDSIKQKYGLSTDIMDALALTFAFPVKYTKNMNVSEVNRISKVKVKKVDTIYSRFRNMNKEKEKEKSLWGGVR